MKINNVNVGGRLCDILVDNGKIVKIADHFSSDENDFGGKTAIPGLVDIHTHGCAGFDTMDAQFDEMCMFLAEHGTTSWLPTTMTMDYDSISKTMNANTDCKGAQILGFHMEGPYINPKKKGAQNGKFIKAPDIDEFNSLPNIRMVTLAPEMEGSMDFIRKCNAVCSIGHTDCTYDTAIEAIEAGAACLTHTFNAMPPLHHRDPGPIGAAIEKQIHVQAITDGLHLHKSIVLALYKLFGPDKMCIISDAMRATGLCDGEYEFGGQPIIVKNSEARCLDGTIAGSTSTLWQCVKKATEFGIPFEDAVKMATETPAKHIGADSKGRIAEGYDADIIILDDSREIEHVFCRGIQIK